MSLQQFEPGTLLDNGKYRVERLLGKGAFGEVYLARQVKLNGLRAIKVVRLDAPDVSASVFEEYRKRFDKEHRLAERVRRHPNVIQVEDVFGGDDFQAAVMEYAPGGSLADLLAREGPQPEERVRRIIADVARGLQALHEQWAIHRDVKPANILIAEDGTAKVADFGLAQWKETNTTIGPSVPGSLIISPHPGTPNYMSPEHSRTNTLAQTADVYSLGCVAFELLTGQPWVFASSQVDSVRELRPEVSAEFDAVVMRMLREVPGLRKTDREDEGKRFVDMGDVVSAVDRSMPIPRSLREILTRMRFLILVAILLALVAFTAFIVLNLDGAAESPSNDDGAKATSDQAQTAYPDATDTAPPEPDSPEVAVIPLTDTPPPITVAPPTATATEVVSQVPTPIMNSELFKAPGLIRGDLLGHPLGSTSVYLVYIPTDHSVSHVTMTQVGSDACLSSRHVHTPNGAVKVTVEQEGMEVFSSEYSPCVHRINMGLVGRVRVIVHNFSSERLTYELRFD